MLSFPTARDSPSCSARSLFSFRRSAPFVPKFMRACVRIGVVRYTNRSKKGVSPSFPLLCFLCSLPLRPRRSSFRIPNAWRSLLPFDRIPFLAPLRATSPRSGFPKREKETHARDETKTNRKLFFFCQIGNRIYFGNRMHINTLIRFFFPFIIAAVISATVRSGPPNFVSF